MNSLAFDSIVGAERNIARSSIALLCVLLVLPPSSEAQTITPSRVRATIGLGLGLSDDGNRSGDGRHAVVSGSFELPLANPFRIRIDAASTRQPFPSAAVGDPDDTAHVSRLTISLATVKSPLAPITPYGGAGIGFYRSTFERSSTTQTRRGAYLHGGIEVHANDAIAVDGEFGLHVIPQTLYPEGALLGEIVARLKIAL